MDWIQMIISLVSGVVGGNAAGALMKDKSLGPVGNSVAGLLGGGIGGSILQAAGLVGAAGATGASGGGMDIGALLGNIAGSGVGGGVLMAIVGFIKQSMGKHA